MFSGYAQKRRAAVLADHHAIQRKLLSLAKKNCPALRVARLAFLSLTLAVWGFATPARAQDDVSTQIWVDYNPRWSWPSGLQLYGDLGVRTELSQTGWGRIVVRPGVRGPIGRGFQLSGGIGGFYTANEEAADRLEVRPFQGISATWPHKPIRLDHYARLEERLEFETDDWTLEASLRFRYRLQTQVRWQGLRPGSHWRLIGHVEFFFTLSGEAGQFDERVRAGLGVERGLGPAWRVRADVTWQHVGTLISGAPTDEIYVRVRVFQEWLR